MLVTIDNMASWEFLRSVRKDCTSLNKCTVSRGVVCYKNGRTRADFERDYGTILELKIMENWFELEE